MSEGCATVIGALIGSASSIAATWLSEHLRNRRSNRLMEIRKETLKRLLSDPKYIWRSIETLCASIGTDAETTIGLLLEIDARKSSKSGNDVWALISKAPFSEG